jgi:dTDP-glucose pyrophosphorylase
MTGVIPAAGRGTRAYPYTRGIPKGMLEIAGEPNLARVIQIMRDQLRIREIVIIIGCFGEAIREFFGDGSRFGVRITYVENDQIEKGLSYSILLSRPYVRDHFCVILSDECYLDSNHEELLALDYRRYLATCAVVPTDAPEQISKNYAVDVENGLIRRIVEKPNEPGNALLGLGTFIFSPEIYDHLERALASDSGEPNDPVSILGRLCRNGAQVAPFYMRGRYVNINDRDELNLAGYFVRSRHFEARTLALVLLMKGTANDTVRTLHDFQSASRVRHIVLVVPPGVEFAADLREVTVVRSPSGLYGDMMRAGLEAADADILVAAYSDGSFSSADVPKFLEYLKDADFVVGTRTTRQLVQQGTNMRGSVRLAHVLLAKFLEVVWWSYEPRFTDVGCAYRALWSATYRLIRPHLRSSGPEYSVEMLVETLKCRKRIIEIPVSFHIRRKGMKEKDQTLRTFFTIMLLILKRRFSRNGS